MRDALSSRLLAALPDAVTAGFFLLLWLLPGWLGPDALRTGLLMMIVEFLLIHATGMIGGMALGKDGRPPRWGPMVAFGALYFLFIAAWSFVFDAWWPFVAMAWLLAGKVQLALQPGDVERKRERLSSDWALSALFYLGGVVLTMLLWLPRLGLTPEVVAAADLPGSGEWVERPHTVVAFGLLYFGLLATSKFRRWRLPGKSRPTPVPPATPPG